METLEVRMDYDSSAQKVPAPGTYTIFNALTYTQQELRVNMDGADMYAASGIYPATFLRRVTLNEVAAVLDCPFTKVYAFTPAPVPAIGKPTARELHRELGRLGFADHYLTASDALGYPVASLAALSADDAYTVRSYARGQWGLSA